MNYLDNNNDENELEALEFQNNYTINIKVTPPPIDKSSFWNYTLISKLS